MGIPVLAYQCWIPVLDTSIGYEEAADSANDGKHELVLHTPTAFIGRRSDDVLQ
jgi:hypothetical protein